MRGEPRDREGFELSLDVRELVSVALGLLVVLGLVFYLGVAVGKDLGRGEPTQPTSLEALDQMAEVPPEELTFPEVLREPGRPVVEAVEEVAEVVEGQREPKPERAEEPSGESAAVAPTAAPRADAADSRAAAEPEAADSPDSAGSADSAAEPLFVVQLASFPKQSEAEAMASSLREKNLFATVVEAEIPGRGVYYRVRVGRFSEREAAKRYLEDLQRETGLEGFVVAAGD